LKIGILHTAFIGDVILSGLLIEALSLSNHEIIYFTKKNTASVFTQDVRIKKVVEIQKGKGLAKIFAIKKIAQQIQCEELDVLLVPHRSATSTLCAYFAKVKQTIGFENAVLSFLYHTQVPFHKNSHECIRYLALIESLISDKIIKTCKNLGRTVLRYHEKSYLDFNEKFLPYEFKSHLSLDPPERMPDDRLTERQGNSISFSKVKENFFILAVGSMWQTKKYPVEQWVDVALEFLIQHPHYYCVLTGSQADKVDIDHFINLFIKKAYNTPQPQELISKIVSAASLFSLSEFALLISYAQFVLSNDSSPVHFASAFNVPVLAIFGPTVPEFGFSPTSSKSIALSYRDEKGQRLSCQPCSIHGQNKCPKGHHRCMKELQPTTVVHAVNGLIK
jgi:heptosyltransferase-2